MRTPLDRINIIRISKYILVIATGVLQRNFNFNIFFIGRKINNLVMQCVFILVQIFNERNDTAFKIKNRLFFFSLPQIGQFNIQAFIKERQLAQSFGQDIIGKFCSLAKNRRIWHERDFCTCFLRFADHLKFCNRNAALIPLMIDLLITLDFNFEPSGKSIDTAHTNAMKAARDFI